MSTESQWLNVQDVAEILQVKDETVRRWIRRRELSVLELGGPRAGYRIRREDLDHFIWQRYQMRHQADADRQLRGGYRESDDGANATMTVRVQPGGDSDASQQITFGDRRQATDIPGDLTQTEYGRFLSLMSRIPGITYISTANPETGESIRRRIAFVNRDFEELLGETSASLRESDRRWWDRVHPDDRERVQNARRESYRTGERLSIEYRVMDRDGRPFWVRDEAVLGDDTGGKDPVWQGIILNISDRKRVEENLQARIRQHAAVAELGEHALREVDVDSLIEEAVAFVQQSLNADYTKILELQPGGDAMLMRAGAGWKPGLAGAATVSSGAESQAGYTLLSNEPVIVDDLLNETRFTGPRLLLDHGVRSGISVIIAGHAKPWGVLGAHSTSPHSFSLDDLSFLQSVANILASAIRASAEHSVGARWLSIRDVADTLRVKEETVRRWIRRGDLPVIDLGSSRAGYRVHPSDLDQFIQERYMKP